MQCPFQQKSLAPNHHHYPPTPRRNRRVPNKDFLSKFEPNYKPFLVIVITLPAQHHHYHIQCIGMLGSNYQLMLLNHNLYHEHLPHHCPLLDPAMQQDGCTKKNEKLTNSLKLNAKKNCLIRTYSIFISSPETNTVSH